MLINMPSSENLVEKKIIALTGATGFVGGKILEKCLISGYRVRVLTRRYDFDCASKNVDIFVGDLRSSVDWSSFVDGVDCVINVAGEISDTNNMHVTNCEGPEILLYEAIRAKVKRWIQISSVGAYGKIRKGEVTEACKDNPFGVYELTKTKFDHKLQVIARSNSFEYVILRPSIVYGVQMSNLSLKYLMILLKKKIFAYIGPRGASANYLHIDDLVSAVMLCIDEPKAANQVYIVSSWATVEDMIEGIVEGLRISAPRFRIPIFIATVAAKISKIFPRWPLTIGRVEALTGKSRYVSNKIQNDLGWNPRVSIRDGMKRMAEEQKLD